MGSVTSYARQLFPTQSGVVVSVLTSSYALGQIIDPIIAGMLVAFYNSYKAALIFARAIVFMALVIMLFGIWKSAKLQLKTENVSDLETSKVIL